jgi:hypothetical protein
MPYINESQKAREKQLLAYLAERKARNKNLTPSITFGNASPCRPSYTGNVMGGARAGDNQHMLIRSAGLRAQIVSV